MIFTVVFCVENRPSADNQSGVIQKTTPIIVKSHYSPISYMNTSSDTTPTWNTTESLHSSDSGYASTSTLLYGSETKHSSERVTTTNASSMVYNPSHQTVNEESHDTKREHSPLLNGVQTPKKKFKIDAVSALPTPPPSVAYSTPARNMMVRELRLCEVRMMDCVV